MKKMAYLLVVLMSFVQMSCGDDYLNDFGIVNDTSYNWHNAGLQFMNSKGKNTKYKEIGTVERHDCVYVQKEGEYFVVYFYDDNGEKHETEKYFSNTLVFVGTITK